MKRKPLVPDENTGNGNGVNAYEHFLGGDKLLAIDRYDHRILFSLRKIIRAVDIHSHKMKTVYHITAPQLICLLEIIDKGPITSSALSRIVHTSQSTLVGVLDRLEQKGYIKRERASHDRRQVNLIATQAGRDLADKAPSPLQDQLAGALRNLTPLEQASIALSLDRIAELMEEHSLDLRIEGV